MLEEEAGGKRERTGADCHGRWAGPAWVSDGVGARGVCDDYAWPL